MRCYQHGTEKELLGTTACLCFDGASKVIGHNPPRAAIVGAVGQDAVSTHIHTHTNTHTHKHTRTHTHDRAVGQDAVSTMRSGWNR